MVLAEFARREERHADRVHHTWTALVLEPDSLWPAYNLGTARLQEWIRGGRTDAALRAEAERYLRQAVDANPRFGPAYVNLAISKGDPELALGVLECGLERARPKVLNLFKNLGYVHLKLGNATAAADVLVRGLEQFPDDTALLWNLSVALQAVERWAESRDSLRRFVAQRPDHWDARYRLFQSSLELALEDEGACGELLDELMETALAAERIQPDRPDTLFTLAQAHLARGNVREAFEIVGELWGNLSAAAQASVHVDLERLRVLLSPKQAADLDHAYATVLGIRTDSTDTP